MSRSKAIITGAGGLIGSEAVRFYSDLGWEVVGVENDMRSRFFGPEASTAGRLGFLLENVPNFRANTSDIRNRACIEHLFWEEKPELVIHTAAQPSHDWAARDPHVDFGVNAVGTLNLLEATRQFCPEAVFIHCSTSKVYGDRPNNLPLGRVGKRLDLPKDHRYYHGIDTTMSIDNCLHSLFGASKVAADILVQEYGRYFGMPTVCFRPGCLTGPAHAGTKLHGFLSYLMKCTITGDPYEVYGYDGLQVRCNIHSHDLLRAFEAFRQDPRPGAVYNMGGGRALSCSMLEAIQICELVAEKGLNWTYKDENRIGDHRWWISDIRPFQFDYPDWEPQIGLIEILLAIHDLNIEQWAA